MMKVPYKQSPVTIALRQATPCQQQQAGPDEGNGNGAIMAEIKSLIVKTAETFEQYKKANDARLEAIEKTGNAPADLEAKVRAIDEDLTKYARQQRDLELKLNRPAMGEKGDTPERAEHKAAFMTFARKGETAGLRDLERKAMSSTSDDSAGYLIPTEMETSILQLATTMSALGPLARSVTIGTRTFQKRVKTSGMSMRRVAEGATGGETTEPTYGRLEFTAFPAEVEPWVNNETLEDADINLESELTADAAEGFGQGAANEYINGVGVNGARGILQYSVVANASYAWGKVGYIASGKAAAFASSAPADKFIDLQHALRVQYRNGARWLMADSVLAKARQLKDGSGAYYLWNPDPAAGPAGTFLGSPVSIDDYMPALASNAYCVAYGNWASAYLIVNRTGTSVIRDNITAKGVTKFNFRRRFGGGILNYEALKLMKMAAS